MKVCVSWDMGEDFLKGFMEMCPGQEIDILGKVGPNDAKSLKDYDVLLRGTFDESFISGNLKLVHSMIKSIRNMPQERLRSENIRFTSSFGAWNATTAEFILMAMLMLSRNLNQNLNKAVNKDAWSSNQNAIALKGKNVTILGNGEIGLQTAEYCNLLGMAVTIVGKNREKTEKCLKFKHEFLDPFQINESSKKSDFIVCALPFNKDTLGIIDEEFFGSLENSPSFIDISRGGIVNFEHLKSALEKGILSGVFLDVFEAEPPDFKDSFFKRRDVFFTPHIAGVSKDSDYIMGLISGKAVSDFKQNSLKTQIVRENFGYEVLI